MHPINWSLEEAEELEVKSGGFVITDEVLWAMTATPAEVEALLVAGERLSRGAAKILARRIFSGELRGGARAS